MPIEFVEIPGADVEIGSPKWVLDWLEQQGQPFPREWFEDETPVQTVSISPFGISRFPITNAQFAEFVRITDYATDAERRGFGLVHGPDDWFEQPGACWRHPAGLPPDVSVSRPEHPVVHMSFPDANAFAEWAGVRLPTEFELEYAARGPEHRLWPWGDDWRTESANCAEHWMATGNFELTASSAWKEWRRWWSTVYQQDRGMPKTTPVTPRVHDLQGPHALGDLSGNVYEWTSSVSTLYGPSERYHSMYRVIAGRYRVVKGGSFMNLRYQLRCAERIHCDPSGWSNFAMGFRVARVN